MALSRNFRTTYYKTLGVPVVQHIVDVEASFAAILSEKAINVSQLLKVAVELGIAPQYRAKSWLLLAGILPPYPELWKFVLTERRAMFEDVVEAAQVLHVKDVTGSDEGRGVYYAFTDLLEATEDGHQEETPALPNLQRLVHLHRTYWREFATCGPSLLRGMDDAKFLLAVARVVCEVLSDEAQRFWGFTRLLEILNEGLEAVDPVVNLDTLYDAQLADFEAVFLRTLDVRRRRQTADGSTSGLHLRTSGHDEEHSRWRC